MKNQFFYKVKMNDKEYLASLNINKVILSLANDEGGIIVILDDFNDRVSKQQDI